MGGRGTIVPEGFKRNPTLLKLKDVTNFKKGKNINLIDYKDYFDLEMFCSENVGGRPPDWGPLGHLLLRSLPSVLLAKVHDGQTLGSTDSVGCPLWTNIGFCTTISFTAGSCENGIDDSIPILILGNHRFQNFWKGTHVKIESE